MRVADPLELELQTAVICHVGAVSARNHRAIFPAPQGTFHSQVFMVDRGGSGWEGEQYWLPS